MECFVRKRCQSLRGSILVLWAMPSQHGLWYRWGSIESLCRSFPVALKDAANLSPIISRRNNPSGFFLWDDAETNKGLPRCPELSASLILFSLLFRSLCPSAGPVWRVFWSNLILHAGGPRPELKGGTWKEIISVIMQRVTPGCLACSWLQSQWIIFRNLHQSTQLVEIKTILIEQVQFCHAGCMRQN